MSRVEARVMAAIGLNVLQPVPRRRWLFVLGRRRRATTIDLRPLSAPEMRRHRRRRLDV